MGEIERSDATTNKGPRGLDITIKFNDNYIRAIDSLKKALDEINAKYRQDDAEVNFGIGYVEDKKLTHGISMGALNHGIYVKWIFSAHNFIDHLQK